MKEHVADLIEQALASLRAQGLVPDDTAPSIQVDRTRDTSHGDLASNVALAAAKAVKMPPRELAQLVCDALPPSAHVEKTEIAGPGFINFFLKIGRAHV